MSKPLPVNLLLEQSNEIEAAFRAAGFVWVFIPKLGPAWWRCDNAMIDFDDGQWCGMRPNADTLRSKNWRDALEYVGKP